jgi:hypothetical protein
MDMPRPNDSNRKLERLVGTWSGEETMHPSPYAPGGKYTGKVRNTRALDGFAVIQDYDQEKDGKVGFRGHGIFRFDQASGKYQMIWFDTFGVGASHMEGTFEGDVLTLQMKASQGHVRATWHLSKLDEYGYLMEVSGDGSHWSPFIEATYRRA